MSAKYSIHIGPTGIDETVRRLDDANQSTAHLGSFRDISGGTERVYFTHPSSDTEVVKRDLREILGYVPLVVRKVRDLYDGLPMPIDTRRAVNAHRNDVIAIIGELNKAIDTDSWTGVIEAKALLSMVALEMGRTTGATSELPENHRSILTAKA